MYIYISYMYISRNSVKDIRASVKDGIAIKRFRDIGSLQIREMTFSGEGMK